MIRKQLYLIVGQEEALKDHARRPGISEAELTRRTLSAFLSERSPVASRRPQALETLLERTHSVSESHQLPSGYRFNREELYTDRIGSTGCRTPGRRDSRHLVRAIVRPQVVRPFSLSSFIERTDCDAVVSAG